MRQKTIEGILVTKPTREDIENLNVGDLAPDCFGEMREVLAISHRGEDVNGKLFVTFYVSRSESSRISSSLKEDEIKATLPITLKWDRCENVPFDEVTTAQSFEWPMSIETTEDAFNMAVNTPFLIEDGHGGYLIVNDEHVGTCADCQGPLFSRRSIYSDELTNAPYLRAKLQDGDNVSYLLTECEDCGRVVA